MKRKELNDLKTKDIKALKKMAMDARVYVTKANKNIKLAWSVRRNLAQIMTVIREKEILEKINK